MDTSAPTPQICACVAHPAPAGPMARCGGHPDPARRVLLGLVIAAGLLLHAAGAAAARPDDFPRPDGVYAGMCPAYRPGFDPYPVSCDDPEAVGPRNFEPITVRTVAVLTPDENGRPRTVLEVEASLARAFWHSTFNESTNRCTERPDEQSGDNALYRFTTEATWIPDPNYPGWVMLRSSQYTAPLVQVGKTTVVDEISGQLSARTSFPTLGMTVFQTGQTATEGTLIPTEDLGCAFPAFRYSRYGNRQSLGAELVGPPGPIEDDGLVRGRVRSSLPLVTEGDPNEVQIASLVIYRQEQRWLPEPQPGQTVTRYIEAQVAAGVLAEAGRQVVSRDPSGLYSPNGEPGLFEFVVPRFVPRGDGTWDRVQYLVVAESGLTDELVYDAAQPPNVIGSEPVHFLPAFAANLSPDRDAPDVLIEVDPLPPLSVKRDLAESLIDLCPITLGPIEGPVLDYLDLLESSPGDVTEAEAEGIERGIWAERSALVGARLSDQLIQQSLEAFARIVSDLVGDFAKFKSKDVAAAEKRVKAMQANGSAPPSTLGAISLQERGLRALSSDEALVARIKVAGALRKILKLIEPGLAQLFVDGGMEPALAKERASKIRKAVDVLARNIETGTLRGVLKPQLQELLETLVLASKVGLMDAPGVSWCGQLAIPLADAHNRMTTWNEFDPLAYRADRDRAARIVSTLSDGATGGLVLGIGLEFLAEASSITQTVGEVVEVASPQAKGATRAAQATKYLANVTAALSSLYGAFGFALEASELGIQAAMSGGDASPARAAFATASAPRAATATFTPESAALKDVLDALEAQLQANRADEAALLTIATEPDSFARLRRAWAARADAFLTQVGGISSEGFADASQALEQTLDERAELTVVEMNLAHRLSELLSGAYSGRYTGADDPAWRADRARVVALIQALRAQVDLFEEALAQLASLVAAEPLLPALDLEIVSLGDSAGAPPFVSASPQSTPLVVRARNLSDVALPAFEIEVEALSPTSSLSVVGPASRMIAGLSPEDGASGSGDDEVELQLEVLYDGPLTSESMLVRVSATEGGEPPDSFVASDDRAQLVVDPAIADADLDGMPTAWEMLVGLDPALDDAALDLDGDGLENALERELGTAPDLADTDDDGLDDGEELFAGADGFRTDPLDPDSDRDGVLDGADGAPTDASTALASEPPPEPSVVLDRELVVLDGEEAFAGIVVSNGGAGELMWSVQPDDPGLVVYDPGPGEIARGSSVLFVKVRPGVDLSGAFETRLHVIDVAGGDPDVRTVRIVSPVPEPGATLSALGALAALGWLRRRRRGRSAL